MIQTGRFWMMFPILLLLGSVGLGVGTVMLATGDPSVKAIRNKDYDDQGHEVDERLAAESISRALGWQLRLVSRAFDSQQASVFSLRILSPQDEALTGVHGTIQAFHNGHPDEVLSAELVADPETPGIYSLTLDVKRSGYWNFDADLQRGEDRFVSRWRSRLEDLRP